MVELPVPPTEPLFVVTATNGIVHPLISIEVGCCVSPTIFVTADCTTVPLSHPFKRLVLRTWSYQRRRCATGIGWYAAAVSRTRINCTRRRRELVEVGVVYTLDVTVVLDGTRLEDEDTVERDVEELRHGLSSYQ